jgi:hypothetical protein
MTLHLTATPYVNIITLSLRLSRFYQYFNKKTYCYMYSQCVFYLIESTYEVAYAQFNRNPFGLPEDGANAAPKHVGGRLKF